VFLLLLLLLLRTCNRLQGQTPEAQRRREGDTLYVQCPYTAQTEYWQSKYWGLQRDGGWIDIVNTNYEYNKKSKDGRIKIKDNSTNKTVSITMTDLKAEDSGTYFCATYYSGYVQLRTISLNVFKGWAPTALSVPQSDPSCPLSAPGSNGNTFIILTVVLLLLLLLALVTSIALGVRYYKLLGRTGNREAEDTSDRPEGSAWPGSSGRRESAQDDSKGTAYINLDVQSHASPEDSLYCNVEPSQAPRNSQRVEYAVIAFSQSPRKGKE
ncbi:CLM7 protein, partial [Certhia brachydactyla]|nr:CLM7 protein [Certhia brachydactyla]